MNPALSTRGTPGRELTIGRWVRDQAGRTPGRTAIDFAGATTTYADLDLLSERLADGLLARGLAHGDRVATLTGNRPEHVALLFACAKAGLILTPMNHRLAPPEIAYQIDDAQPALLLVGPGHDRLASQAVEAATHAVDVVSLVDASGEIADGTGAARDAEVRDDDPLLLIYTSGTTGRPKGALLTHGNCFWTNLSFDRVADVTTFDTVLQVLPQFHVGGWNVQALLAWWKGATVVLEPDFDPGRALRRIEEKQVTTMMGVPATYLFISEEEGFAEADLTSLRLAVVGGAPMPEALLKTWGDRGVELVQGYGLTEAAPNVLCVPPEDASRKLGYAGKPYPHVDVALRDPRSGTVVDGPGEGEILVRGPNVFPGYWRNDEATAEAFVDGWLRTGDIAARDDEGFYRIRDRVKEMYISGGENVYPAEVESVLHDHPNVVEAAVVGVPDARWGEAGIAFVVARRDVEEEDLVALCRERLARFKVPKKVVFVEALPRNAAGKVEKAGLRDQFTQPSTT